MAILTSKGARAPHQLKGRRNVRISRDRRGCGNDDIEQLKEEVNNALAECQKKYYIEGLKDANLATSYGITDSYRVNFDCANTPVKRIGVLTVYGYTSGQYSRITQEYVTNDDSVTTGEKYIRYGMSNDNGISWTWSNWEKLVIESEISTMVTRSFELTESAVTFDINNLWAKLPNSTFVSTFYYMCDGGQRTGVYTKYDNNYGWIMVGFRTSFNIYTVNNNVITQKL